MTIREHLTNKIRLFFGVAMLFWLLFAGSIVLDNVVPSSILSTIAFCGFGASVLCVIFLVRCPRCEGKLGAHGLVQPFGRWPGLQQPKFCPFCGVRLDDQV